MEALMGHGRPTNREIIAQFASSDEGVLSEEFVLSEEELLAEFWEQCSAATERNRVVPEELRIAAKAFCRMQQRLNPESS